MEPEQLLSTPDTAWSPPQRCGEHPVADEPSAINLSLGGCCTINNSQSGRHADNKGNLKGT